MKQLIQFTPLFDPVNKTVDFEFYPQFNISKLYAIINITQNTPIYVPGAPGLGMSSMPSPTSIVLQFDTTLHNQTDELNVYYETTPGQDLNTVLEKGGNLQALQESCNRILKELMVMNYVMANGLNIKKDDVDAIRNDLFTQSNNISID